MARQSSSRVLVVAPYEGLATTAERIAQRFPSLAVSCVVGNLEEGVAAARALPTGSYDVVGSRGGTADLLRESLAVPVIDIPTSALDVLRAIKLSEQVGGRRAVVGFPDITKVTAGLNEVMDPAVDVFTIVESEDARPMMALLRDQGYQTLVCDVVSGEAARELGLGAVLVTASEESVQDALAAAADLTAHVREMHDEDLALRAILRNHGGETVVLTRDGELWFATADERRNQRVISYLRELVPEVETGGATSVRKSIEGYLYSIHTSMIITAGQPLYAFYYTRSRAAAKAGQAGITYFTRADAEKAWRDSFYSLTGDVERIAPTVADVVASGLPMLVAGEYGTGRTAVASWAYVHSHNADRPLVEMDCGLLTDRGRDHLLNSSASPLFGAGATLHVKDFDGCTDAFLHDLLSTLAHAGTCERNRVIFSCDPRGETVQRHMSYVKDKFQCVEVELHPLRESRERIPAIASLYLTHLNAELPKETLRIEGAAMQLLEEYRWPGNYIQFARVLRNLCVTSRDHVIRAEAVRGALALERPVYHRQTSDGEDVALPLDGTLAQIERAAVDEVMRRHGGNQSAAAKQLGISRTTLWRMYRKE